MRAHKKSLAILAAIPLLAGLSACRANTTMTIDADKNVTLESEFADDSGILKLGAATCNDLTSELNDFAGHDGIKDLTVTDISTDSEFACKITATGNGSDDKTLSETDDGYVLDLDKPDFINSADLKQIETLGQTLDFSLTFVMPGDVTKAPTGFTIEGSKASTTDLNALNQPIRIESTKEKSPATAMREGASTFFTPSTILIICLAGIALIAVITLIIVSRKRKAKLDIIAPGYSAVVAGTASAAGAHNHGGTAGAQGGLGTADAAEAPANMDTTQAIPLAGGAAPQPGVTPHAGIASQATAAPHPDSTTSNLPGTASNPQ